MYRLSCEVYSIMTATQTDRIGCECCESINAAVLCCAATDANIGHYAQMIGSAISLWTVMRFDVP